MLVVAVPSAVPAAHAATQADLKSWNTFLSAIATASVADVGGQCKTNYDSWIAARTTYGCSDSDPTTSCATLKSNSPSAGTTDYLTLRACCYDKSGGSSGYATLTGTWASCEGDCGDEKIDNKCKDYIGAVNTGWSENQKKCCEACADTSSANYPFLCTKPSYSSVSVCKSSTNTEGNAPLPIGFKCSTSPSHSTDKEYEVSNIKYPVPASCSKLRADRASGVTGATVYASVLAEDTNTDYGKMSKAYNFVARAVLAGGEFKFNDRMGCGVFLEPTVGRGGKFTCIDSTAGAAVTTATTSNMELFIYKPTVLASAAKSVFEMGSVHIVGGSNAGEIEINQFAGSAKIQGMVNSGTVTSTSAKDLFICDTANQATGSVTASASTAVVVNVTNSGTVTVNGGTFHLYDTTNAVGGTVNVGGAVTATASGITNAGTISITGGTIDMTLATNSGGTITIATGVTGTLTLASGGDPGTFTVPATVTLVGFAAPPSPRAPPSPAMPPPVVGAPVFQITTIFSLSGSVLDYDQKAQGAIKAVLASEANVSTAAVVLSSTAGSVIVTSDIFVESQAAADQKATALASGVFQNATTLETALTKQFTADGVVMNATVEAIITQPTALSSTFGGGCDGGCVGGIIGGICGPLFGILGYLGWRAKKQKSAGSYKASSSAESAHKPDA